MISETHPFEAPLVTIFLHNLMVGGAERVMLQLAQGYEKAGIKVDIVLSQKKGDLLVEVPQGVRVVDLNAGNVLATFLRFASYLKKERPGVVLSTLEGTSLVALLARMVTQVGTRVILRISVAISMHKRSPFKKFVERYLISFLYPLADDIIAVSQGVADDLTKYVSITPDRIKVIYNPVISSDMLAMSLDGVDHPFFKEGSVPVVLGVGRLTRQKGFQTLIHAFAQVVKKRPARLIILGEGNERLSLEAQVRSLSLNDFVDLPGAILNPYAYMKRASVFVLSSQWEGLPGALIQAMACGCPVVSTDCVSGPGEILENGKYGHLVPVGDTTAMVRAIEEVLDGKARLPFPGALERYDTSAAFKAYRKVIGV